MTAARDVHYFCRSMEHGARARARAGNLWGLLEERVVSYHGKRGVWAIEECERRTRAASYNRRVFEAHPAA